MNYPARRAYAIFGIVCCAFMMSSIDGTIVAVALPTILNDLHTSLSWVGWTLTGFQLTNAITMALSGKLAEQWGARRVLLTAIVVFTGASMVAGIAPNVYVLIIARIVQALGGGALMPSATGLVADVFGDRKQTFIGLFSSIFPLGGIIGPNIGGFIIDNLSWRWLFYVNLPIGIVVVVAGLMLFPKMLSKTNQKRQMDVMGAGMFAGGMIAILLAMTAWGNDEQAFHDPMTWLSLIVGFSLLGLFVRHEGRISEPIIDMQLLKWRPFAASNLYNFLYGSAAMGFFSFIPYYASVAFGMSAEQSGLLLTPRSLAMMATSTASSFVLIRFGYRWPMILGVALISTTLVLLSFGFHDVVLLGWQVPNVLLLGATVLISGIGMGVSNPASSNASLELVPGKVAAVAGLRGMFRASGGVLGTATIILALSLFEDKALGARTIFFILGIFMLSAIPVTFFIPDGAAERRKAAAADERRIAEAVPATE